MIKNIYIHIPFCSSKCSYCNFSTIISKEEKIYEKYVNCLIFEIENYIDKNTFDWNNLKSIYFWWWTPSIIEPELIWKIIKAVETHRNVSLSDCNVYLPDCNVPLSDNFWKNTEILMECNPQNISEKKLKWWKKAWITKISIWIQTFQSKFFNFIERDIENVFEKIVLAKKYFPNLSVDFIFWYPDQNLEDLKKDLKDIEKLKITHLSFYALDYKPNSKIEKLKWKALSFEKVCEFYWFVCDELKKQWFEHYETYNFAKKWNIWVHNVDFWNWNDYLWFWLSAVWTVWNEIFENTKNLKKYLSICSSNIPICNSRISICHSRPQSELRTGSGGNPGKNNSINTFQKIDTLSDFDKKYLLLERWFRLISWIEQKKLKKLVDNLTFEKIKNSNFIKIKDWFFSLKEKKMMFFNDFFEEIFS